MLARSLEDAPAEATADPSSEADPPPSIDELDRDGERVILIENEEGEPLSIGRKSRIVPAAIRRAVWARDRHCRFPGCARTRFVDIHHIRHRSKGGETRLDKLRLLCGSHHRLLHEGRLTIEQDYRGHWFFRRPDGRAIPACGYRPEDMTDDDVGTAEAYCHAHASAEACPSAATLMGREPSHDFRISAEHDCRNPVPAAIAAPRGYES